MPRFIQHEPPKLHALARLSDYIYPIKVELLTYAFIKSQFNYGPLLWMFHYRRVNAKLNKVFGELCKLHAMIL